MDGAPLLCEQIYCTGCMACYNSCPQTAITMKSDDRGFLYPFIHEDLCVNCRCCEQVCPVLNPVVNGRKKQEYYAFKHNDINVRLNSSSGGFFTWLSDIILDRNGVVYGSTYDDNLRVIHGRAETKSDRDAMRGSKYVQSYIGNIYQNLKCDLEKGRWVLFTGTPCQCEAALSYLGKSVNIEKLVTMDFICEGVASPLLFEEFKKYENEKFKSEGELTNINFRDKERYKYKHKPILARRLIMEFKKSGVGGGTAKLVFDSLGNSRYLDCMFSGLTQRESCLKCKYHSYNRNTDFTCGDFHRYHGPVEFKDNYGISEILVNTNKGSEILNYYMNFDLFLLCTKEEVWQPLLSEHIDVNLTKRDKFWGIYKTSGYKKATDIIMPKVYKRLVRQKLARTKQNLEKFLFSRGNVKRVT